MPPHAPHRALLEGLGDETYVSLTTFRRSGTPVPTAVWLAVADDALVVTTPRGSGKVKRLRHTADVELRRSDRAGRVADDATLWRATASLEEDAGRIARAQRVLGAKYGLQYGLIGLVERVLRRGRRPDRVIVRIEGDRTGDAA